MDIMKKTYVLCMAILVSSCASSGAPEIIILDKHTKVDSVMAFPEKNLKILEEVRYAVVKNMPEDPDSLLNFYFEHNLDRSAIQNSLDRFVIKFFNDSGEIGEGFENDEGYLTVDRIDDHVDELIGVITWQRHGNVGQVQPKWKLSVKDGSGIWKDRLF